MEKLKKIERSSAGVFKEGEATTFNFITHSKEEKFKISWRIDKIPRYNLRCREFLESSIMSSRFFREVMWTLRLYPRGRENPKDHQERKACIEHYGKDEGCEFAGIFLHRISANTAISSVLRISYKIYALNSNSSPSLFYSWQSEGVDSPSSFEYGTDNFACSESEKLRQALLVTCTVYVRHVYNIATSVNCNQGFVKPMILVWDMETMFRRGKFSDITLQARGEKFPVHKAVLASRSSVFEAMFQDKKTETKVVEIEGIEPELLRSLLKYIYTGIPDCDSVEKAISLYSVAQKYKQAELKKCCVDMMLENLSVENVCQIVVLADFHRDQKLKEATFNMFRIHKGIIFKRKEWQELVRNSNRHGLVSDILMTLSADCTGGCHIFNN